jgi:myo-inositol-1(or 4)-monophosphatase
LKLEDWLAAASAAARAAGALLRDRPTRVSHKGAIDLVTELDLASESLIRERLAPTGIPVQGEEGGGVTTGRRWVVDPLDGTTNFVHDYPHYAVSIALCEEDTPRVGVIYDPLRDRLHGAATGGGATLNGAAIRVSQTRSLADALCVTGFPYDRREKADVYLAFVERVLRATQGMRRSGSAACDLATLACGSADVFWEFGLKAWDTAAGQLIVAEAGGRVTRMDGSRHVPGDPEIVATNGWLHEAALRVLGG